MNTWLRLARYSLFLAVALLVICPLTGSTAFAQSGKVGWVDLDRILRDYEEFKEAENLFQKDAVIWEADFDSLQTEYFTRLEDYKKQRLVLSEQTRRTREEELAALEQSLLETKARYEGEAERRRMELTAPILKKIQETVQQVAVAEDFDYVLNGSQLYMTQGGLQFSPIMYAKDRLDLTNRVFEELEKLK